MTAELNCPSCDRTIESTDDLETGESVPEVETNEDGSFQLFSNRDLFLCSGCKNPMGVGRSRQ